MKTIAFFNNKGGVGKTSLAYHLAWMYADLNVPVLAVDLDPQANLSSMFLDEPDLEKLWPDGPHPDTIAGAIRPLLDGTGDITRAHVEQIGVGVSLLVGDLSLAVSEDDLSGQWSACLDRKPRAFRVISAFWRAIELAADESGAALVLIDVGPNLGAINRASLIAAQHVVVPLAPDLFSLQGLKNLGPTLRRWRAEWGDRRERNPETGLSVPAGEMRAAGYVVLQHAVRLDRPVQAYDLWMQRIPRVYREAVLAESADDAPSEVSLDSNCLSLLKHYRSLMPLAQEAHKPMFYLTAADGAIGGHAKAVQDCYWDFRRLALVIAERCGVAIPVAT
jgi:cellulose biosynthesis protein BcsQ